MTTTWADDEVMGRVKRELLGSNGVNGVRVATQAFQRMDTDADGCLSAAELKAGLDRLGIVLTSAQIAYLVKAFDKNRDGRISAQEFINEMIFGSLAKRRLAVIDRAFAGLAERFGEDPIPAKIVLDSFDVYRHPAVEKKIATPQDITAELSGAFGVDADQDGKVSKQEFRAFFAGLSYTIPNDDVFEALMLRALAVDDGTRPRLNETALACGTQPARFNAGFEGNKTAFGATQGKNYNTEGLYRSKYNRPVEPLPSVLPDYKSTMKLSFPHPSMEETCSSLTRVKDPSPTGDPVLDVVRRKVLKRAGSDGFAGLARSFRIMDTSNDQKLTPKELKWGLERLQIHLTPSEVSRVFANFGGSSNGSITVGEFARTVRGPIRSQPRIDILLEAFQRLDPSNDGVIALQEIAPRYDASQHADVRSGKKTEEEVVKDFISDWDGNGDGRITIPEWMDYYGNISCAVDDDRYFELMIRNAWHISGGTGVAQNTSCRRVLAKFANGKQKVLEIKDDLGLRKDDIAGMIQRLASQGHTGIVEIQLYF